MKSSTPDFTFQISHHVANYAFSDKINYSSLDEVYHVNQRGQVASTKATLSIYYSSRNPKKATELTEETLPVHNKWNIKLNTCICLYFMYITCKNSTANLKLTDNLIVSRDTSTLVYDQSCWVTWLQHQEASGFKQRLIACVLSLTEWSVSNVATRILIRICKFRAANKTLPPLRIFVTRNPWHPFAEPCLRNNEWDDNQTSFCILDEPGT